MFSGTARTRDRLRYGRKGGGKVTAISVFDRGSAVRRDRVLAGQIGKLWGLGDIRIGDAIGEPPPAAAAGEETVHETLRQGLHGWQVTDAVVTLTDTGYWPRQSHAHGHFDKSMSSTAGDFRGLTPLVVMSALERAGTTVCEPMHRFRLEAPADAAGPPLPALVRLGATPLAPAARGSSCLLEGEIPAAQVQELQRLLPTLTRGEGVLDCAFDRYKPVRGAIPGRPRSDHNPLSRKEYLLHVLRRA